MTAPPKKFNPVQPKRPVAPPVYRPQPTPKVLQTKSAIQLKPRQLHRAVSPRRHRFIVRNQRQRCCRRKNCPLPGPTISALNRASCVLTFQDHSTSENKAFLLVWDPGSKNGNVEDANLKLDVPKLERRYGQPLVEKPGTGKPVEVSSGGVIHILAHGSGSDIAQIKQPKTIAEHLAHKFGKNLKGKTVIFYACEIGDGGTPFVKQITTYLGRDLELSNVKVIGPVNETYTLDNGSTRVLKHKQTAQQHTTGQQAVKSGTQDVKASHEDLLPHGQGWVGFKSVYQQNAETLSGDEVENIIRANT
jgi:hypothetical protein